MGAHFSYLERLAGHGSDGYGAVGLGRCSPTAQMARATLTRLAYPITAGMPCRQTKKSQLDAPSKCTTISSCRELGVRTAHDGKLSAFAQ